MSLYYRKGTLRVDARGFWFSLGGGKGSFGYYPHLKNREKKGEFPIIADTQLHGNMRVAARWLLNLCPNEHDADLEGRIFGAQGGVFSGLLKLDDLRLSRESKMKWSPERFVVRARCEIDDATRTNASNMLAFFEYSYMEGLTMESDIFLGYFDEKAGLESACELINQSLSLIPGLGGSRSRGYGHGKYEIVWQEIGAIHDPGNDFKPPARRSHWVLTCAGNLRNKRLHPGSTQLLDSVPVLSENQLRGWFSRAWKAFYGEWPGEDDIRTIRFSWAYPAACDEEEFIPACPPPLSTVRSGKGVVQDMFIDPREEPPSLEGDETEGFILHKPKPLSDGFFVTREEKPRLVGVRLENRIRNAMEDNFCTKETDGLFVQQLVPSGTSFLSEVVFENRNSEFAGKAHFLLSHISPVISGTVFNQTLSPAPDPGDDDGKSGDPRLLIQPFDVDFDKIKLLLTNGADAPLQVRIGTVQSYNTMLKRPRRNRIVFLPGSLMADDCAGSAIRWRGLGKEVRTQPAYAMDLETGLRKEEEISFTLKEIEAASRMSRAQAGKLRRFLSMPMETAKRSIEELLEKYGKEGEKNLPESLVPRFVIERLYKLYTEGGKADAERQIRKLLEKVANSNWEKKKRTVLHSLQKIKNTKGGGL